ncbi:hypothetical protein F2P56_020634 [Juglans regia]|uniref:IRK-interacting protein-like n=2 Tax=Juglans regia TaxID=51240 RepID=A0A2I4HWD0_JUGRE|nr:IRK-interacting protein-like [Juglans regia]KAF5460792.1 hypothetical protein F2P56_020634 [Juglans regia]
MTPASSASLSPSSKSPPLPSPRQSPHFTPIQEFEREEHEEDASSEEKIQSRGRPNGFTDKGVITPKHHLTPLNETHKSAKPNGKKSSESDTTESGEDDSILCNKCRPHAREKISVVPLDNNGPNKHSSLTFASPNGVFKAIFSSLTRKSPRSKEALTTDREKQWKITVAQLSHKLLQATRKRDEALLEASRLKCSMAELEKKLNKLEVYCHNLKSGLEEGNTNSLYQIGKSNCNRLVNHHGSLGHNDKVIEDFLVSVSEARSSVQLLCRSLTTQFRQMGSIVYERLLVLLHPYNIKVSLSKNPRSLPFCLEALLNKAFYEDFESVGFQKNASNQILNPIDRCEASFESFNLLEGLTWEEVLNKGTRHFSEEFSRFCDRKMSEIVAMLGWNRAWPEPLLQAFFFASKSVWLVHLLATSVHPSLPIFRVDKGVGFDGVYMEDIGGDMTRTLVPSVVRIMVAPGFYVYGSVVKCKVICVYNNCSNNNIQ